MAKEKSGNQPKKSAAKASAKKAVIVDIEKISEQVLTKLQALDIEHGLQADIQWCIGSYRHDKNPVGLYQMLGRALPVLKAQREKNARSVAARLITDIEKALANK